MLNLKQLQDMCQRDWKKFPGIVVGEKEKAYRFIDRGGKILLVAHLDHRSANTSFGVINLNGKPHVFHGALDDRLGAHLILNELADLTFDVLLTTNEESGDSSSQYFKPDKTYNWIASFDRRGVNDVAMYQYMDGLKQYPDVDKSLRSHGFTPVAGSYSCIADMDTLGVMGFNFSAGYYAEHTITHNASIKGVESILQRFRLFYAKWADTSLPYQAPPHVATTYYYGSYGYSKDSWDAFDINDAKPANANEVVRPHQFEDTILAYFGACDECGCFAELNNNDQCEECWLLDPAADPEDNVFYSTSAWVGETAVKFDIEGLPLVMVADCILCGERTEVHPAEGFCEDCCRNEKINTYTFILNKEVSGDRTRVYTATVQM